MDRRTPPSSSGRSTSASALAAGAAHRVPHRWSRRSGGSPACWSRAPTASRSCATPRPTRRWPTRRSPPRCCGAWATGSSTARDGLGAWIQPDGHATSSPSRRSRCPTCCPSWRSPARCSPGSGTGSSSRSIIVIGLVLSVRGAPVGRRRRRYGGVFKAWTRGGPRAWPFRSTPRAVPLIVLGLAVFLGAGVGRAQPVAAPLAPAGRRRARWCSSASTSCRCSGARWSTATCSATSEVPSYWTEAAAALDAGDRDTRVYEMPGIDFAVVPLGQHRRPDHPRPDRPRVRRPRAHPLRLAGVGQPAQRRGTCPSRRVARTRTPRPAGPAAWASARSCSGPTSVRAVPHPPSPTHPRRAARRAGAWAIPAAFGDAVPNEPVRRAAAGRRGGVRHAGRRRPTRRR